MLRLFVYGTLKFGQSRHHLLAARAERVEPAQVWGQLYHLPAGYPMLVVPSQSVLATGTDDPYADLMVQNEFATSRELHPRFAAPDGDEWDRSRAKLSRWRKSAYFRPLTVMKALHPAVLACTRGCSYLHGDLQRHLPGLT